MVRLRSAARPVRRARDEVQFGLSPTTGIVLAGLTDPEAELLVSLAGTGGTARDVTLSRQFGVPLPRVEQLIDTLRRHGLLTDREVTTRPPAALLGLCGRGSVVERLRQELLDGGVQVVPAPHPPDTGSPQGPDQLDLAVLCTQDVVAPDQGQAWQRSGVRHLPVVVREGEVVIGPLVRPGRSACLHCLDLHRGDLDGAWPRILTQLSSPVSELTQVVEAPSAVASTIAGLVTALALECLNTPQAAVGLSWQISLPWPQVHTRRWAPHPRCGCVAVASDLPAVVAPPVTGSDGAGPGHGSTGDGADTPRVSAPSQRVPR